MSYWPPHLPRSLPPATITLPECLEASAALHPEHTAVAFFGRDITYRRLQQEVEAFAGWLRNRAGVNAGDRVILYMQNSPQWVIAYYGVLRAGGIVVPVNPMNRGAELQRYIDDSGAEVAVCSQELFEFADTRFREIVVAIILITVRVDFWRGARCAVDFCLPASRCAKACDTCTRLCKSSSGESGSAAWIRADCTTCRSRIFPSRCAALRSVALLRA